MRVELVDPDKMLTGPLANTMFLTHPHSRPSVCVKAIEERMHKFGALDLMLMDALGVRVHYDDKADEEYFEALKDEHRSDDV